MQRNRTIRDHHHKQLHADKIDNLAKLTNSKKKGRQKEAGRENTNRPTNQTSWNWNCDLKTSGKQESWTGWLHRQILSNVKRKVNPYPSETLPESFKGENTANSLYKATITLDTKARYGITKKENYRLIFLVNTRYKNPQQNASKLNPTILLKDHMPWQVGFIIEM